VAEAVAELKREIARHLGHRLHEVRVFGSVPVATRTSTQTSMYSSCWSRSAHTPNRWRRWRWAPMPGCLVIRVLVLDEHELALQRDRETALADALDRGSVAL
jgi:hypothetical protein